MRFLPSSTPAVTILASLLASIALAEGPVCLVDGRPADGDLHHDYAGFRVHVCSNACYEKTESLRDRMRLIQETGRLPVIIPIHRSRERSQEEIVADMAFIPGGDLQRSGVYYDRVKRGETPEAVEYEPYVARISPFHIDKHEVSNEAYLEFLNDGNSGYAKGFFQEDGDDRFKLPDKKWAKFPVRSVNYFQAKGYAEWAGKRLPTEAEWEFAHGGAEGRKYPWGDEEPGETRASYGGLLGGVKAVASIEAGATPEGVFDLAGNVGEWCADFHDKAYYGQPTSGPVVIDPQGPPTGFERVYRLGCQCRTSTTIDLQGNLRCHATPFRAAGCVGFRCARSAGD